MSSMMQSASREPTLDEIEQFLKTRTQAQIMQLVQNFDDPVQRAHFVSAFLNAPRINVKSKASSKHAKESEAIKAKKALNAFVAFRCFYIHCLGFKPWPMKKLSNSLGKMWELDLNKPLWSMMAKAWSLIRDQIGKDNASLTEFLNIVCPYLHIPPCKDYLDLFQWEVNISDEGLPVVRRDPEAPIQKDRASGTAPTTLSVKDIIEHCQMSGYALNFVYDTSATSAFQVQIGSVLNSSIGAADSVFQDRVAARNKRRTRRQSVNKALLVPDMRGQIDTMHDFETSEGEFPSLLPFMPLGPGLSMPLMFQNDQAAPMANNQENFDFNIPVHSFAPIAAPPQLTMMETENLSQEVVDYSNMSEHDAIYYRMREMAIEQQMNFNSFQDHSVGDSSTNTLSDSADLGTENFNQAVAGPSSYVDNMVAPSAGMGSQNATNSSAFRPGASGNSTLPPIDLSIY